MIELERHIEILLLSNDCVILPELGGFMAHAVEARYDDSDGMFIPPLRTLGFNPQLTMNDSLLVQSYIEAYDLSYPEALRRIEEEVAELRQHLETEGFYELNDIGVLRLNDEGRIEFEPCEAGILTPGLYGLGAFEMPTLSARKAAKGKVASLATDSAKDVQADSSDAEDGTTSAADGEANDGKAIKDDPAIVIKMSWLRNAAAVAAAIIAFFLIQTPVSNSNVASSDVQQSAILPLGKTQAPVTAKKQQVAEQPSAAEVSAEPAETAPAAVAVEEPAAEPVAEKPAAEKPAAETTKPAAAPQHSYCIVLASQTTRRLAENFINQLKKDGHSQTRMMDMLNTKKVRVVYGSFSTEQEAHNKLATLRSTSDYFAEAWILKI